MICCCTICILCYGKPFRFQSPPSNLPDSQLTPPPPNTYTPTWYSILSCLALSQSSLQPRPPRQLGQPPVSSSCLPLRGGLRLRSAQPCGPASPWSAASAGTPVLSPSPGGALTGTLQKASQGWQKPAALPATSFCRFVWSRITWKRCCSLAG